MSKKVSSGMEILPVLLRSNEVGIPTKSLNTVQQKNYREYADKVCKNITVMLGEIRKAILGKLETENVDKVRKEIINANPEITEIVKELKEIIRKCDVATNESLKIMTDFESKKAKLMAEMETKIASLKSDKMLPLTDLYIELKDKLAKAVKRNTAIINPLLDQQLKISTGRQYSYDHDQDDDDTALVHRPTRNLQISYPSLNTAPFENITEVQLLNHHIVRNWITDLMAPAISEFEIAEVKLETMEQNVKEIMMFDETQMNEAFQKLFAFRDSIQQKHLEVVRKINYNLNEE